MVTNVQKKSQKQSTAAKNAQEGAKSEQKKKKKMPKTWQTMARTGQKRQLGMTSMFLECFLLGFADPPVSAAGGCQNRCIESGIDGLIAQLTDVSHSPGRPWMGCPPHRGPDSPGRPQTPARRPALGPRWEAGRRPRTSGAEGRRRAGGAPGTDVVGGSHWPGRAPPGPATKQGWV